MVVQFEKCELKIDQIHKEEFSKESFVQHEINVIELIQRWLRKESFFKFKTSGSTGKAKTIVIEREKIEYSCETTMEKLDSDRQFRTALLCLDPTMIGGAMVVFRALLRDLDLKVIEPISDPFSKLSDNAHFDLTSMVPMQLYRAQPEQLNMFNTILVGGANYSGRQTPTNAKIYSTFGMTETVSHFALRLTGEEYYECLGDIQIKERSDKRLAIHGTLTNHKVLITNDLIDFISTKKFKWLGRQDFVINSGGLKISPEEIETKLSEVFDRRFIISSLEDDILGNKIILILEGESHPITNEFSNLSRYEKPKSVYFISQFPLTHSQKVDRLKTRELLLKSLNME